MSWLRAPVYTRGGKLGQSVGYLSSKLFCWSRFWSWGRQGVKTVGAIVVLLLYNALAIAFWVIVVIVVFNLLMILL
jgi:hypothetical protein